MLCIIYMCIALKSACRWRSGWWGGRAQGGRPRARPSALLSHPSSTQSSWAHHLVTRLVHRQMCTPHVNLRTVGQPESAALVNPECERRWRSEWWGGRAQGGRPRARPFYLPPLSSDCHVIYISKVWFVIYTYITYIHIIYAYIYIMICINT